MFTFFLHPLCVYSCARVGGGGGLSLLSFFLCGGGGGGEICCFFVCFFAFSYISFIIFANLNVHEKIRRQAGGRACMNISVCCFQSKNNRTVHLASGLVFICDLYECIVFVVLGLLLATTLLAHGIFVTLTQSTATTAWAMKRHWESALILTGPAQKPTPSTSSVTMVGQQNLFFLIQEKDKSKGSLVKPTWQLEPQKGRFCWDT